MIPDPPGPPIPPVTYAGPYVEPVAAPPPGRRRVSRGAIAVLALAAAVLVAGAVVAWLGTAAASDADHEHESATQLITDARGALRRAQADLVAADAAIATFQQSAQGATAATAHIVDLEDRMVGLLSRLRAAGESEDIGTYNRTVDQLNALSDELVAASDDLEGPLRDFSDALEELPTARCTGAPAATITWADYGGNGLSCARLLVPVDYDDPAGEQTEIAVVKRPADDPASGLGPLVLNPGGPGASGVAFMRDAILLLPPELLRRFDLIAFDPRGIGHSSPVDCADDLDPLFEPDLNSESTETREAAVDAIETVIQGCADRTGPLLGNVDTVNVARDMDRMRAALGAEKLSYLGFSYGTYLGAVYAELFPNRIRAAVLDGGVDPGRTRGESTISDPGGFSDSLRQAFDDCKAHPDCAFHAGGNPSNAYELLMTSLTTEPLVVGERKIGRNLAELAVVSGLYEGATGWPKLMSALARAAAGDGQGLLELSDRYTGRRADGSYDNEYEAHYAVNCIDFGGRMTPAQARSLARRLPDDPPRFETVSLAFALPCAFWPAPTKEPDFDIHGNGAAPILVVGGEHDPATPIEGSEALADALTSATLLRWEGTGHTAFTRGNQCIDGTVIAYLVDLKVPAPDTSCPAE